VGRVLISSSVIRGLRSPSEAAPPDHPDLPARVSVLMVPALGVVTALLPPRVASAVFGNDEAMVAIACPRRPFIRFDRSED
jgi:hypothetical protein